MKGLDGCAKQSASGWQLFQGLERLWSTWEAREADTDESHEDTRCSVLTLHKPSQTGLCSGKEGAKKRGVKERRRSRMLSTKPAMAHKISRRGEGRVRFGRFGRDSAVTR